MQMSERFTIRPYRPNTSDRAACSHICVCTGQAGTDARDLLSSDEIHGEIWVLPYLDKHPEYAWVVQDAAPEAGEEVVGYIVGTPDTRAFEAWFHRDYWPPRGARFGQAENGSAKERDILQYAATIGDPSRPDDRTYIDHHPAHLHINLLRQAQGKGLGSKMLEGLFGKMARDGIEGIHLGAAADNDKACEFYLKRGMREVQGQKGARYFVKAFSDDAK